MRSPCNIHLKQHMIKRWRRGATSLGKTATRGSPAVGHSVESTKRSAATVKYTPSVGAIGGLSTLPVLAPGAAPGIMTVFVKN